jgi:regulator of replication initiation timing
MKKLTKVEAAKALNVSRTTVYNLIKRGVLTPDENGLIVLNEESSTASAELCQDNLESLHDVNIEHVKNVHDVHQSSSRLKEKYIAHLETEVRFLRQEVANLRQALAEAHMEHRRTRDKEPEPADVDIEWAYREYIDDVNVAYMRGEIDEAERQELYKRAPRYVKVPKQ